MKTQSPPLMCYDMTSTACRIHILAFPPTFLEEITVFTSTTVLLRWSVIGIPDLPVVLTTPVGAPLR